MHCTASAGGCCGLCMHLTDCACIALPVQENAMNYDKGVLAEILEPIMGKGLIPADLETWKVGGELQN